MAKMVKAWNARTGEPLPHQVPQSWLDKGLFAGTLSGSQSAATRAAGDRKPTTNTKEA